MIRPRFNVLPLSSRLFGRCGAAVATTPPAPGVWILASNSWADSGVWVDAETWND